ncbi:metal dependent hydrolase [Lachnospiraceae bacterium KM106-2]|nr:metal dependent hydrolase [Lachnospiraceae bacterium KM106-2]
MRVTFIEHSGFAVEFDEVVFIFDYYKGDIPQFPKNKQVIFFVSHKHQDHFNKQIFTIGDSYKKVTYLLSNDTKMNTVYMNRMKIPMKARTQIRYIHANETMDLGSGIRVETLRSTDEGVAFIVSYENKALYHAGDLNWWSWSGEPERFNENMKTQFFNEIQKVTGRHFDIAFLPLDPRQEERFYWGLDAFMRSADVTTCFPMHMWNDFSIIRKLKEIECAHEYENRIVEIKHNGEQFSVS